ncbi:MAG TPA: 23S rRNA (cytidine(2498)-2'-O)-methyltransferase RlmM [Polyangiaceae bacterium]|nr:23S rRNA (cytidine(2498)-2'-O)-methyltransferase RlmM [Polyangiaceae bacterium]
MKRTAIKPRTRRRHPDARKVAPPKAHQGQHVHKVHTVHSVNKVHAPVQPQITARFATGAWLLTCREGSERDLCDELLLRRWQQRAQAIAPALVVVAGPPQNGSPARELTFARQGFKIALISHVDSVEPAARQLAALLQRATGYALQVWTPDSSAGNALSAEARSLENALGSALAAALPQVPIWTATALPGQVGGRLVQACLLSDQRVALGIDSAANAISLAPGGRNRVHVPGPLPSRSARKLEEALQWFGTAPGKGELCVDLGAAPGGWTYVLCGHGAKVIAVDPGALRDDIAAHRAVIHKRQNAFQFEPEETCDWLFCDMAYRPLEVAALLAKWGRNRWARLLVANIKLPMTKKAEIVMRVKEILEAGAGWKNVRAKQLYHDRDEVTLCGYVT